MPEKVKPIGVCDHCGGGIPPGQWYTSKRRPRLHCSFECKQAANSQAGAPIRREKMRRRVERGEWQNPHHLNPPTPEEQSRRARLGRKREVTAGAWRNPALDDEARAKLSRPRKHRGVLHAAIEKLGRGLKSSDLTEEEREAFNAHQRRLVAARRDEVNAIARKNYRRRQNEMTDEEREAQRAKWRVANRRRADRKRQ